MRIWRSLLACMGLLAVVSTYASGQSNAALDRILAAKQANFAEAAYLVLTATKKIPDSATFAQAARSLEQQSWGIKMKGAEQPLTLGSYCFMIMKAFGMRGGIMYSILPGPRYAARELVYRGFVHDDGSPYRTVSGMEVVNILGSVLEEKGGTR